MCQEFQMTPSKYKRIWKTIDLVGAAVGLVFLGYAAIHGF
jgi:hypothetical protein